MSVPHAAGCGHHHGLPRPVVRDAASRAREKRNLFISLGIAAAIMVAEVVGGLLTNSLALLSDAGHMLTDASAVGLSLVALSLALRPRDHRRTYGYHRLEILAALFNGLFLVGLSVTILYHAYERFSAPPKVDALPMLGWASLGLVANVVAVYFLSQSRESLNTRAAFLHVLFDTISSVFVVAGGVVMYYTEWYLLDPILSCLLATLILVSSIRLGREAMHVLLEGVPTELDLQQVQGVIEQVDGVKAVHDLHVWSITSGMRVLSAHVVVTEDRLGRNDEILRAVKRRLCDDFGIDHTTIQIESESYEHVHPVC